MNKPIILPVITAESNSFESFGGTLTGIGFDIVEIGVVGLGITETGFDGGSELRSNKWIEISENHL